MRQEKVITRAAAASNLFFCLSLASCGVSPIVKHEPGTSYGSIVVSSPKVMTREALVNDRLREARWLEGQLDSSDSVVFGIQGKSTQRGFTGISAGLSADIGPQSSLLNEQLRGQIDDVRDQRDFARLQSQVRKQSLENLKNALGTDKIFDSTTGKLVDLRNPTTSDGSAQQSQGSTSNQTQTSTTGNGAQSASPQAPALEKIESKLSVFENQLKLLDRENRSPDGTVTVTPVDLFRDRLTYRQEIRRELLNTQLDDRHDLRGSTLYRLQVDATIVPQADTSAWAILEYELLPPDLTNLNTCDDDSQPTCRHLKRLYHNWLWKLGGEFRETIQNDIEANRETIVSEEPSADRNVGPKQGLLSSLIKFTRDITEDLARKKVTGGDACIPETKGRLLQVRQQPMANLTIQSYIMQAKPSFDIKCNKNLNLKDDKCGAVQAKLIYLVAGLAYQFCDYADISFDLSTLSVSLGDPTKKKFPKVIETLKNRVPANNVFVYAASPKEMVERVSEIASARKALDLAFLIQVLSGNVLGKSYLEIAQQREGLFESLKRQPIVVGFGTSGDQSQSLLNSDLDGRCVQSALRMNSLSCEGRGISAQCGRASGGRQVTNSCAFQKSEEMNLSPKFGWVMGPRFRIRDDGEHAHFRHSTIQHGLDATIVVPSWWPEARLTLKRGWVTEDGFVRIEKGAYAPIVVPLPIDASAFSSVLTEDTDPGAHDPEISWSSLSQGVNSFTVGESAQIILRGRNLTRSPQLSLGSQITKDVEVLAGMNGIVAKFSKVENPGGLDDTTPSKSVKVWLWTATGATEVAAATIKVKKKDALSDAGTAGLNIRPGSQLAMEYGKTYCWLAVGKGKLPALAQNAVRVSRIGSKDNWVPLAHSYPQSDERAVCFHLQFAGTDADKIKPTMVGWPIQVGLFTQGAELKPIVPSTYPILYEGTPPKPKCSYANKVQGTAKSEVKLDFAVSDGLKSLSKSMPPEEIAIESDQFQKSPAKCKRTDEKHQTCEASVELKDKNSKQIKLLIKISADADEDAGFGEIVCTR